MNRKEGRRKREEGKEKRTRGFSFATLNSTV